MIERLEIYADKNGVVFDAYRERHLCVNAYPCRRLVRLQGITVDEAVATAFPQALVVLRDEMLNDLEEDLREQRKKETQKPE